MGTALLWLLLAIVAGLFLNALVFSIIGRRQAARAASGGISVKKRFYRIFQLLVPLFLILLVLPTLPLPVATMAFIRRLLSLGFIILLGWAAVKGVLFGRDLVLSRYDLDVKDNLKARAVYTQLNILAKIAVIVICLITVASGLMLFDHVRQMGTSILASAGVIGIIIGFAAQRSIATLLAGLQLAVTQPIRIDDVVIVDGEWGQIEEITLTYVVVRIWDLRRLVVPTGYFLEKSFQNWTRTSADLLATVMLYADYTLPIEVVRNRLQEIAQDHPLWDHKVCQLQVTNATEKTIELRALVSAASSSNAWNLRCHVREQLLIFLQQNYPQCLPRIRAEILGSTS